MQVKLRMTLLLRRPSFEMVDSWEVPTDAAIERDLTASRTSQVVMATRNRVAMAIMMHK